MTSDVEPFTSNDDPGYRVGHAEGVDATSETGPLGLYATRAFAEGEPIARFSEQTTYAAPSALTLEVDDGKHVTIEPEALRYINHACEPNVLFDVTERKLIALRPILPGEQFFCFYPATEWSIAVPFHCNCGAKACLGDVHGADKTPLEWIARNRIAPHILRRLGR